jgi:6-phosphogluconolactonase
VIYRGAGHKFIHNIFGTIIMTTNAKHFLFVGSYAPEDKPGIYAFLFDSATGDMTPHGSFAGITNPSFLTVHPNGKWLYAVSETGLGSDGVHGSVHALKIEQGSLNLQPINWQSTQGDWPCHVVIDGNGRFLIASNYGTGNAALFPILPDGGLGEMTAFVQHEGQGANKARQEGPHAHSAVFTPDNRFLVVADLGIDQLVIYQFDAETGSLSADAKVQAAPGAGPRHFAFHPDGQQLLVANELDSTVTVYDYDAGNGTLHALQTVETLPTNAPESSVADIHFSPSGQHVYVSNRGHNSVAVFSFGDNGRLTRLAISPCGGNWPRNFALSPDGQFMLVANRRSDQISVLPIHADGSEIGAAVVRVSVAQPSCITFTSNSNYAAFDNE